MLFARISGLLTLASIAFGGSMAALKTGAYAAEATAILPVMSCEALANSDFTALDARITSTATVTRNDHLFCDVKGYITRSPSLRRFYPLRLGAAITCNRAAEGFVARPM
jgi:hypothetical protein